MKLYTYNKKKILEFAPMKKEKRTCVYIPENMPACVSFHEPEKLCKIAEEWLPQ